MSKTLIKIPTFQDRFSTKNPFNSYLAWEKSTLKIWGELIVLRDNKICVWCKGKNCNNNRVSAHHIISRNISNKAAMFDIDNGITLGYKCHIHGLKDHPIEYSLFILDYFKNINKNYFDFKKKHTSKTALPLSDLKIVYYSLNEKLNALKNHIKLKD